MKTAAMSPIEIGRRAPPALIRLRDFIIRRRIILSAVLFAVLVIEDVVTGVVPHDLFDFTDTVTLAGVTSLFAGLAMRSWAAGFLVKNDQLTTTGPYALVRNPLYLGSFLMVLGFCLLIGDRENIFLMPIILLFLYVPKVHSEERFLAQKYGGDWRRYASRTGRFIPRRLVWPTLSGWRGSQWLKSREYNALLAVDAALLAIKVLHDIRA